MDRNMTAEEMTQYYYENIILTETSENSSPEFIELNTKVVTRHFEMLLNEVQSDEKCLLCFTGVHKFKSMLNHVWFYEYILTNRRLIMAGRQSNAVNILPYYNVYRKKDFKCHIASLYLNELSDVTAGMVKEKDVITFHAKNKKDSFNVMFAKKNLTHKLCKEIHNVLEQNR